MGESGRVRSPPPGRRWRDPDGHVAISGGQRTHHRPLYRARIPRSQRPSIKTCARAPSRSPVSRCPGSVPSRGLKQASGNRGPGGGGTGRASQRRPVSRRSPCRPVWRACSALAAVTIHLRPSRAATTTQGVRREQDRQRAPRGDEMDQASAPGSVINAGPAGDEDSCLGVRSPSSSAAWEPYRLCPRQRCQRPRSTPEAQSMPHMQTRLRERPATDGGRREYEGRP